MTTVGFPIAPGTVSTLNGIGLYSVDLSATTRTERAEGDEPDPGWSHTDSSGHFHAYVDTVGGGFAAALPTLRQVRTEVPCDGRCGGVCEGGGYDVISYACRLCSEDVVPGVRRGSTLIDLGSSYHARVSGPVELYDLGGGREVSLVVGDMFAVGPAELVGMVLSDGEARVVEMSVHFSRLYVRRGKSAVPPRRAADVESAVLAGADALHPTAGDFARLAARTVISAALPHLGLNANGDPA